MNEPPAPAEPTAMGPGHQPAVERRPESKQTRDTMSKLVLGAVLVLVLVNTVAAVGIWWTVGQIRQTVELEVPPIDIDPPDPARGD